MELAIIGFVILFAASLPFLWLHFERKKLRARYAEIDAEED